jgi:hypothetical protein
MGEPFGGGHGCHQCNPIGSTILLTHLKSTTQTQDCRDAKMEEMNVKGGVFDLCSHEAKLTELCTQGCRGVKVEEPSAVGLAGPKKKMPKRSRKFGQGSKMGGNRKNLLVTLMSETRYEAAATVTCGTPTTRYMPINYLTKAQLSKR